MIGNFSINTINFKHFSSCPCVVMSFCVSEASVWVDESCCACIRGVQTSVCLTHDSLLVCRCRVVQQGRNQPCYRLWRWRCSSPPRPAGALSHLSHSGLTCPVAASSSLAGSSPDIQGHDFQGHRESCPVENTMENGTEICLSWNSEAFPLDNMVCSLHSHYIRLL